ncbi:hypothetical protein [Spirosoma sp.]|uniref:hypothetical protein n=1 Tax=Spirosoma sp. TaxID=1899569 RepID=UPI00261ED1BB|nr:hypothetical protein [Spirosoma sp.]MCX6216370.1 hypothetical protein [Spirosoma sp.]
MNASVPPQQTPAVVEQLFAQLQQDCGASAMVTFKSQGYRHAHNIDASVHPQTALN